MKRILSMRFAALAAFFAFMALGVFAQNIQTSEARYMTPQVCSQMKSACDLQEANNFPVRSRICSLYKTLCSGWDSSMPNDGKPGSSGESAQCGPNNVRCAFGYDPICVGETWKCMPWSEGSEASASSVSSGGAPCGASNILCIQGTLPQCINGNWQCVATGSSSSRRSLPSSCIARCPDGYQYRTCTEDGHPINYFVDPCMGRYSSASSASNQGCYCTKIYRPVCGTNGKTYGNECEARCASTPVDHQGVCGGSSSSVMCPVYDLAAPPAGCRYVYEKNDKGCDVPRLVCSSSSSSSVGSAQAFGGCKIAGCSSQLCVDQNSDGISTCEWREQYACYRGATCERQASGQCGWTQTPQLQSCLNSTN